MALFLSQFGLLLKKYSPKSICSIFEGQKYVEFANEQAANHLLSKISPILQYKHFLYLVVMYFNS